MSAEKYFITYKYLLQLKRFSDLGDVTKFFITNNVCDSVIQLPYSLLHSQPNYSIPQSITSNAGVGRQIGLGWVCVA